MSFALLLSVSGFAQSTTAAAVYQEGNAILDRTGNLIVVSPGRSTIGVTVTGLRHSFFAPMTRITVVPKGATAGTTIEYNGSVLVIGVGPSAMYAIATTYTVASSAVTTAQSLIAIKPSLPAGPALSGFSNFTMASPFDARAGSSDYISLISEASGAASRTTTVVHFNGSSFEEVSSATRP